jgi:hypothetical protein
MRKASKASNKAGIGSQGSGVGKKELLSRGDPDPADNTVVPEHALSRDLWNTSFEDR